MPFEPDLHRLHRQLAYRPGRESVSISVEQWPNGLFVSVDDNKPLQLTNVPGYADAERPVRAFAAMMRHYPAPATVNGEPVERVDFPAEPSLRVAHSSGSLMNPGFTSGQTVHGDRFPGILVEGVRYEPGVHPESGPQPVLGVSFTVADRQDEQPHYARESRYTALPNYRWDNPNAAELARSKFEIQHPPYGFIVCRPPRMTQQRIQQEQLPAQEQAARNRLLQDHDAADIGPAQYLSQPYDQPPSRYRSATGHARAASIIPYARKATMDRNNRLDQATRYSLATALYNNPEPGITLVQYNYADLPELDVVCAGLTVVTSIGETLSLLPCADGTRADFALPERSLPYEETGCRAITAHLVVNHADGKREEASLPLKMFCSGEPEQENIWMTDRWREDHDEELSEVLFNMFWPQDGDPPEWITDEAYAERLDALAIGLLDSPGRAYAKEVDNLCASFTPRNLPPADTAAVTAVNRRHSVIVQPNPDESIPAWLAAAVAGVNPELDGASVRAQAKAMHDDPELMSRLRDALSATHAA